MMCKSSLLILTIPQIKKSHVDTMQMGTAKKNKIVSMSMSDNHQHITAGSKLSFVMIIKEVKTADMATDVILLMEKSN